MSNLIPSGGRILHFIGGNRLETPTSTFKMCEVIRLIDKKIVFL